MTDSKKTILLVEDDALIAVSEKNMLQRNGYKVLTALDGAKAIETALNNDIDLILMDIELGSGMDGHNAAREIISRKNVPVVFLTAHVEKEMVEKVKSITRYGYALKNTGEYVLLSSIEMVFKLFEAHENTRISEEKYRSLVEDISDVIFSLDTEAKITYISPGVENLMGFSANEVIGNNFLEFVLPEYKDKVSKVLHNITLGESHELEFRVRRKNGRVIWLRSSLTPVQRDSQSGDIKGILSDITPRKDAEEKIKELILEKDSVLKELNCLYNISKLFEKVSDYEEILLKKIPDLIKDSVNNPEEAHVVLSFNGREYFSSENLHNDGCVIENEITIKDEKAGFIQIWYPAGDICNNSGYLENEKFFLETVSANIGKKIELMRAKNELSKMEREIINISEQERQRIGHELHDGLGQILTGISFMVANVRPQIAGISTEISRKLEEISGLVKEATRMCRHLSKELPCVNIEHDKLIMAIDQLASNTHEMFGINCQLEVCDRISITDDFVSSQIYRIIQEAITNSVKHSGADNIYIFLLEDTEGLVLEVRDDGNSQVAENQGSGMGLNIMKYRAGLIGGEFSAGHSFENGFVVKLNVPTKENALCQA